MARNHFQSSIVRATFGQCRQKNMSKIVRPDQRPVRIKAFTMAKKPKIKIPNTVPKGDHILDHLDLFTGKSLRDELAKNGAEMEDDDV